MDVKFDMTRGTKVIFGSLQEPHALDFLLVVSVDDLGRHVSGRVSTILKYRFMILLFLC